MSDTLYTANAKKIMAFGMLKGYIIWLISWVVLLIFDYRQAVLMFLVAFVFGMVVGILWQVALDAGKVAFIKDGKLYYGRPRHMKTIQTDTNMSSIKYVQFSKCTYPVRLQSLILNDKEVQQSISFNYLNKKDFNEMCSELSIG